MRLAELFGKPEWVPPLNAVIVTSDGVTLEQIAEGKTISGRFDHNIRLDQPTHLHGDGKQHAHVFGRRGDELGVVNFDGSPSHGSKFRLHQADAAALRARGFSVRSDNIVEWLRLERSATPQIIFG